MCRNRVALSKTKRLLVQEITWKHDEVSSRDAAIITRESGLERNVTSLFLGVSFATVGRKQCISLIEFADGSD